MLPIRVDRVGKTERHAGFSMGEVLVLRVGRRDALVDTGFRGEKGKVVVTVGTGDADQFCGHRCRSVRKSRAWLECTIIVSNGVGNWYVG